MITATLEVKSKAPNGVAFKVTGKSTHEHHTGGQVKYTTAVFLRRVPADGFKRLKLNMSISQLVHLPDLGPWPLPRFVESRSSCTAGLRGGLISGLVLTVSSDPGLTLTQAWTTHNSLDTKLELENGIAKGLKAEVLTHFLPATQAKGAKVNLFFKQPNIHARAFFDLFRGPTATLDAVIGHEGFLAGAEAAYDLQKAAITRYSAAVGYTVPEYTAAITATNNLSVFSASYYHKVNSQVEAGAKATWDSKGSNNVGLELASKYRLDPTSFAKVGAMRKNAIICSSGAA